MSRKRIAIVGSGVTGLAALYALRDSGHEIHLFEAEDRLGGHTNTVDWKWDNRTTPVDTGFIVMNTATYPNFISFLNVLGITTAPTEMSFGISRDRGAFEWCGTSLGSVFAQRSNIIRPSFWRMIFDIIRFNQCALDLLTTVDGTLENPNEQSIGDYLQQHGYSEAFRDGYLIPMTACVWSTGPDKCALEFPAVTLVRFLWNHHLLSTVAKRPDWLTIPGGSKKYIDAIIESLPTERLHLSTPVKSVENSSDGRVILRPKNGPDVTFDDVILACHGDQAMGIISNSVTKLEKEILGSFQTTPNTAYLHCDLSLMPTRREAWASWNYLIESEDAQNSSHNSAETVTLTYNMNILQHLSVSDFSNVLVTMNPPEPPDPKLTQATFSYRHPLYNNASVYAQSRLDEIQGIRGIWYAGAWTKYGFHEDGFTSGVSVAKKLGGSVPWKFIDAKYIRGRKPSLGPLDYLLRIWLCVVQIGLVLFGKILGLFDWGSSQAREKKLA